VTVNQGTGLAVFSSVASGPFSIYEFLQATAPFWVLCLASSAGQLVRASQAHKLLAARLECFRIRHCSYVIFDTLLDSSVGRFLVV
jgi:hypothetical protein